MRSSVTASLCIHEKPIGTFFDNLPEGESSPEAIIIIPEVSMMRRE
jgi:hypothetical protein